MIVVDNVILAGSVLRAGFPWRDLLGKRVRRVINDCGAKDSVLLISQFGVLFTGMAGRTGFSGATSSVFRNRYKTFGHSGYFRDTNNKFYDDYMKENWLPIILGHNSIPEFDDRQPKPTDVIVALLANNAEPIKLMVYASPFVALFVVYLSLYQEAET